MYLTYLLTQHRTAATPTSVGLFTFASWLSKTSTVTVNDCNLGSYLSSMQHTAQGKDFELIITVKMETRYLVGGPFGREFLAFVITVELWRPKVARPAKFCEHFLRFFLEKNDPSQTVATARIAPKICQASPTFGSHCSGSHPNRFTCGWVIAERVKTVFAP